MLFKILIDNDDCGAMLREWGLSIYIEYRGRKILLDTGAGCNYIKNASQMGADIRRIDYGVLSHAHYDHSGGLPCFFNLNHSAKFYIRTDVGEDCYSKKPAVYNYIGLKRGILEKYCDRFIRVTGDYELFNGAWLIPHKTDLTETGRTANMFRYTDGVMIADNFSHEQSLVLETLNGLVVFNGCSHGGVINIINEVKATFPDKDIHAFIGGMHLFRSCDGDVYKLAGRLKALGIQKIVTGHCTGARQYAILKAELGTGIEQFYSGYTSLNDEIV